MDHLDKVAHWCNRFVSQILIECIIHLMVGFVCCVKVLLPGSYKLEILAESGSKTAFQGAATCSPFDVSVATRTNNLPAYDCYNGDSLPSSAASWVDCMRMCCKVLIVIGCHRYYSWAYGGPQDEDGEVVLFGDNFLLDGSDDASVDQYIHSFIHSFIYYRFLV